MIRENKVLFKIPLVVGYLDGIDNEKLVKDALDNSSQKFHSNPSHTFSEDSYISTSEELIKVFNSIKYDFWSDTVLNMDIDHWWAHIQEPNMSAELHNHKDFDISGVYYPYIPKNSGFINFMWHQGLMHPECGVDSFTDAVDGTYLLFPSNLDHFVTRNLTKETRVSISFNAKISSEHLLFNEYTKKDIMKADKTIKKYLENS